MGPMRNPNPRGSLWVYTYGGSRAPELTTVELTGFPASAYFHPLGIDITPVPGTNKYHLFVINHSKDASVIDLFSLELRT